MNQSRPHFLVVSLLINLVLFSAIAAVGFPVFNSGDDVYLMYLLGGGFGQAPTELLHYNHIMHPYLGLMIKNLFNQFPEFNWYTAILYLFHFIPCAIVLWQWLRSNTFAVAVISFTIVFFSIEARFLLQPSFTNTALVTAVGATLVLYDAPRVYTSAKLLAGYVLVLAAVTLRMHMLIPVVIIAAPFLLLKIKKRPVLLHAVGITVLVTLLIFLQQQYYKQHIPGWQAEENYRKAVINYYNLPKKKIYNLRDSAQYVANFIEHGILWDTTLLSSGKISAATENMKLGIASAHPDFGERLYWLFMENRLALLIFLSFFIYMISLMTKREKLAATASALLLLGLCFGLLLFRKLPPYVIPGCLFIWFAFTGVTGTHQTNTSSKRIWIFGIGTVLLLAWSIARLYKLNNWNKQQHQQFVCAYNQVAGSPDKLFIASDDKFPMDYFHVWHTPHQYSLPNILYKDHFLNNTYQPVYKRFNIRSPSQFPDNKNIVFIGRDAYPVPGYYQWESRRVVYPIPVKNNHGCINTWQLIKMPGKSTVF